MAEATGDPVVGAEVSAGEQIAATDADGRFVFDGLAPGNTLYSSITPTPTLFWQRT